CALSLIKTDLVDPDDLTRVRREAQAMAQLGAQPNIVTVFDIGDEEGRPYIVCEYVSGGDLRQELYHAGGSLPLHRAVAIAMDVCRALAVVHRRHGYVRGRLAVRDGDARADRVVVRALGCRARDRQVHHQRARGGAAAREGQGARVRAGLGSGRVRGGNRDRLRGGRRAAGQGPGGDREVLARFVDATNREDLADAMDLLRELDRYLTREEAAKLSADAQSVVEKHRQNLTTRFKMAVNDRRWSEAVQIGDLIVDEFPNTKVAEEVISMIEVLRTRATEEAAPLGETRK
ncbi:MAG: protein kinase, partial [Planctomycetes bacterium]|nr:protein kinase [Planctomycetota bacterium]